MTKCTLFKVTKLTYRFFLHTYQEKYPWRSAASILNVYNVNNVKIELDFMFSVFFMSSTKFNYCKINFNKSCLYLICDNSEKLKIFFINIITKTGNSLGRSLVNFMYRQYSLKYLDYLSFYNLILTKDNFFY